MDRKQATNIEVKKNNRNRIYRYICGREIVSNPDISYELKMSLPTVTQITKELIGRGLVEEKGELESTGGRRAKALSAVGDAKLAVGLDITQNHISLVLANLFGEILKYERLYQPYVQEDDYWRRVSERLEIFLNASGADREKILGVGISFPGIIDLLNEKIAYSHILGVEDVPFALVGKFFPYPCAFLNDANAGAYAEAHAKAHAEACAEAGAVGGQRGEGERFFYLPLSNTVGGAVFSGNELIQGKNFRCGEAGHMTVAAEGRSCYCGKKGCLDAYCRAGRLSDAAGGSLGQFFEALDGGDEKAARLWEEYTDYLAIAVNNIHMLLDCDVVLGGYVGGYADTRIQEIRKKVSARNTFAEEESYVRACRYKIEAAALGAALMVTEEFVSQV